MTGITQPRPGVRQPLLSRTGLVPNMAAHWRTCTSISAGALVGSWRGGAVKAMERENASFVAAAQLTS